MTRTIIIIVLFFLFMAGCSSKQVKISDKNKNRGWVEENLSGRVKSIKEESAFYDSTQKESLSFYYYNDNGFLTKWNLKNKYGFYSSTFEYDERGNIIKSQNSGENNDFTITKYDYKDRPVESTSYSTKSIFKWNKNGNESKINIYNLSGELQSTRITLFNEKNNPTEYKMYNSDGKFSLRAVIEYDKNGKLLKKSYFNEDGSFRSGFSRKYDERGNVVVDNQLGKDRVIIDSLSNEYLYDKTGNWIEKGVYTKGEKIRVVKRIYEYY